MVRIIAYKLKPCERWQDSPAGGKTHAMKNYTIWGCSMPPIKMINFIIGHGY